MSSSITSLGVYLNTYNTFTLVQNTTGEASTDNSAASNTALSISNVLKDSEDSASVSATADSVASSDASSSEDSSSSGVSVYA